MIETSTSWEDTGRDCTHCGGIILERIDQETGQPKRRLHQCRECGCQWTLTGEVERVGRLPSCRVAAPAAKTPSVLDEIPRRIIWLLAGGIAVLLLLRFGIAYLALIARLLIPIIIIALFVYIFWRLGREQGWWDRWQRG